MKLTWHIVRKDLARLTVPLGLWIAFVVSTTAWFAGSSAPVSAVTAVSADLLGTWIGTMHGTGLAGVLLQATVGALLTAVLVLEDLPAGTVAFWLTRPASGVRLLAAKFAGATLFFAVMPALALSVVWLAFGFTLGETAAAAVEYMGWQLVLSVPALALAATTGSLGRFVFVSLGVWLLVVFTMVIVDEAKGGALLRPPWVDARSITLAGILLLGSALAFGQAYLRRRRSAWILLTTTMVLMIVVRVMWKHEAEIKPERRLAEAGAMAWERLTWRGDEPVLTLTNAAAERGDVFLAPTWAMLRIPQSTGSAREFDVERSRRWGEAAALRVAGFSVAADALAWELGLSRSRHLAEPWQQERMIPPGEVRLVRMHGRVLWEVPLRDGAEIRVQSSLSRIVNIGMGDDRVKRRIVLQERDARLALDYGIQRNTGEHQVRRRDEAKADCFLLVNRSRGYAHALAVSEVGTARMHSLMLSARILEIEPAVPVGAELAAWDDGATIIKVRFSSEGAAVHAMPAGKVSGEEEKKR